MKTRLALVSLPIVGLVACGPVATESSAAASARPTVGGTAAAPATSINPARAADLPPPTSKATVRVERSPAMPATVTGIRFGRHTAFDRIVIDLDKYKPGYRVGYVPRLVQDGSGHVIKVKGGAFLEVRLEPSWAHDENGRPTWGGPRLVDAKLPNVIKIARVSDFEGVVKIGLVLKRKAGFRVLELSGPNRLVIDVAR
ncbi:hypothetical protein Pth03_15810 [Planotetraspora thailandica]|uniref:AMIN-like domain-containing protein n=1 Tax=Planotetraspora thailandica TaxID=487172 RepID=A0A8J3UX78_9ACTN|nr:hypothetical protein [Planotetraspora thailandica]GII53192.1 hypothetical protein Pth03_15810 [Planotetraspora thailandica]